MPRKLIAPESAPVPIRFGSDRLRAECLPEFGGRLSALAWVQNGTARELLVPMDGWTAMPWRWPKTGAYPLFPFSNRIRHAQLVLGERRIDLAPHPDAAPHTVHGPAHLRPWQCVANGPDSASLALDYTADEDWPWSFRAEQTFAIRDNVLSVHLSLKNTANQPFPAGLGWHPYFHFGPGAVIAHDARTLWVQDESAIATGQTTSPASSRERTDYLSDWSHAALVYGDGLRLEMMADPIFGHLVCHRPDSDIYACIEPVTHVADGFNLAGQGVSGTGTQWLEPGATLRGNITLRVNA